MKDLNGKWQLVAGLYYEDGNPDLGYVHPVVNGYTIDFSLDGTFISNYYAEYNTANNTNYTGGIYTIDGNSIITLTFTSLNQENKIIQQQIISYTDIQLDLSSDLSTDGISCIEGCGTRYSKIIMPNN